MTLSGWLQLLLFIGILATLTKPMGLYLEQVLDARGRTRLELPLGWLERFCYRLFTIDPHAEQSWKDYGVALLLFTVVTVLLSYGIMRLQGILPLNPQALAATSPDLAFNTAISFATNTNWQSYPGEMTMSYLSQMSALATHNFFSAAIGIAVAAVLVRAIARDRSATVGNFWTDLVRINLYLLAPISVVYALFLVSQGVIDNFLPYTTATSLEQATGAAMPATQSIGQGPAASQVAIKMLGTNGGGFFNANAAHPFENPTALSNFVQMLSIFLIPAGLTYYLGRQTRNLAHGWAVWVSMAVLFLVGVVVLWAAEAAGNPHLAELGIDPAGGNMEGKEVRFGIFSSALFATITTDASCGAVNCMHDSLTPLGGLVPLFNMHLGEVVFGGVGSGLYGMLIFVILAIFIAGLMVGRTPEYLGKKINAFDVKMCALAILAMAFCALGFTAWSVVSKWGNDGLNNAGPHGFSEMLYAFSSVTANNGSAFAGLTTSTPWYNTTLALGMVIGRYFMIIPVLALAGSLAAKKLVPPSSGTFPVAGPTFVLLLIGTVLLVGALNFLPSLAFGPIVEHFLMWSTRTLY
jgi:potassium-transporting ATPase potassium-binding subunit